MKVQGGGSESLEATSPADRSWGVGGVGRQKFIQLAEVAGSRHRDQRAAPPRVPGEFAEYCDRDRPHRSPGLVNPLPRQQRRPWECGPSRANADIPYLALPISSLMWTAASPAANVIGPTYLLRILVRPSAHRRRPRRGPCSSASRSGVWPSRDWAPLRPDAR